MRQFNVILAGVVEHEIIATEMKRLQQLRIKDEIPDTLIMVEHPEVVTIGPKARKDGVEVPPQFETSPIDRGGGITWHGPGQIVAYPIFLWDLDGEKNVAAIIHLLEDWIINTLRPLGIIGERDSRMQGIWKAGHKFSSVGLNFMKWVSRHGLTINYNTPEGRVEGLPGCGLPTGTTTSLNALGEQGLTRELLEAMLISTAQTSLNRTVAKFSCQSSNPPWPN
ncbi:MAG TPA: lipoyl(octanoyl) transferase [Candidatus Poseidoniales archaeon]|nr:MAG: lipoyl(octanoyl) transferase [Euryarchaeota archaeon]HIA25577.1 lipoyl(octanoyl) transferase LipB [Candidatus Poseidoniales archaeon]PXY76009.1 MAG: lipoyl(octanoyl) transferase [Euryarchaeota archaeon]PXY78040.1 MAG: lipoyl(octanoyl) transferase [Euryarchaeota archaeon]PXY79268.1 MAG: lipoyl(octanoyl) transferase [Euryarchaeota archaeon]